MYNLDSGDCRQPHILSGRIHGRNDWTKNTEHCQIHTAEEVVPIVTPRLHREFSDGGTSQALPVLPNDEPASATINAETVRRYNPLLEDSTFTASRPRQNLCSRVMESAGECTISGGNKTKKRRKQRKSRRKRKRKTRRKSKNKTLHQLFY